ncbi:hypothetical protein [Streptomyces albidoflavus]|uniref:hypothetical protein n=1 Tax=Streptomyces albidoflavus TaxID=1886 RepID=UPI001641AA0C|nr:hypothetical protein [Streptomyces albidoflavus]
MTPGRSSGSSQDAGHCSGAGPKTRRPALTAREARAALAPPPITAPIPNGATRPRTTMPCLVPYFVTKFLPSTLLICRSVAVGTWATTCLPRCGPVRSAALVMVPERPGE